MLQENQTHDTLYLSCFEQHFTCADATQRVFVTTSLSRALTAIHNTVLTSIIGVINLMKTCIFVY